jgi:diguanylate cyclase (GGDEF)-like protein/PAS domain S-box-containing protein
VWRLAGCFLTVGVAAVLVRFAPLANHLIWIANGVLLAYLLLAPRKLWASYLFVGYIGQVTGSMLVKAHWQQNLVFDALNIAEVLISAFLLRRSSTGFPRFTDRAYLLRFIAFAVIVGPVVVGSIYTLIQTRWFPAPGTGLMQWAVADGLGAAVATPACVAVFRAHFKNPLSLGKNCGYLILLAAVIPVAFSQNTVSVLFILYPLLILLLVRLGLGWASMATLFVAAVGSFYTLRGQGPFGVSHSASQLDPAIGLQVYIASAMFMLYTVSVVLESHNAILSRLKKIVALHALVTENSRDAIILADFDGNRTYVSAAAFTMFGWNQQELSHLKSLDLLHTEDRAKVEAGLRELRSGTDGAIVEARVRRQSGGYVWAEANLRVVRDPRSGKPTGLLNIVRDITDRKRAEQQLQEAYRAVEALAVTDPLTGLANRRQFDQRLTAEWRRSLRDRKPLSLLLLDVDLFKAYNDTYGHVRGDSCLKQIAEAAQDVVTRPGDIVARFGGEEFTIILPNTDNDGASKVADAVCDAVRNRNLLHSASPFERITISVGCATILPSLGRSSIDLVELADKALYQAKRNGRNQVCTARGERLTGPPSKPADIAEITISKTA